MNLTCPKCLTLACVRLDLCDGDTLHCPECDDTYALADVVAVVESWSRVLPWIMRHPARIEAAATLATTT